MTATPVVQHFFDKETNTFSYVVTDPATQQCAIIDSVLNYDAASASTSTEGARCRTNAGNSPANPKQSAADNQFRI